MTVAVGFMCSDGIVLAADREVSTPTVKIDGPKAWTFWYPRESTEPVLRIGIVGAGDYGFIKFAAERIDEQLSTRVAAHSKAEMDDVNQAIQLVVTDIHHEHIYPIGQPHERPSIDLMIGIWLSSGRMRLARTSLTAVTKVWNYEAIGIGSDLAYFLVKRFYTERIPLSSAMFWASYVLMHAKNYVPGCGSGSDVIALFKSGTAGLVKRETVKKYEQFANEFESAIHPAFLGGADETVQQGEFMNAVDQLAIKLKTLRDPTFIQRQAQEVYRHVSEYGMAGRAAISMGLSGHSVASQMAERQATLIAPQSSPSPEDSPTPEDSTRDPKDRPPSQE